MRSSHSAGTTSAPWWRFPSAGRAAGAEATGENAGAAQQQDARRRRRTRPLEGRWRGATVVCIASGPSLTADDCEAVAHYSDGAAGREGRRVIAVNNSWQRVRSRTRCSRWITSGGWNTPAGSPELRVLDFEPFGRRGVETEPRQLRSLGAGEQTQVLDRKAEQRFQAVGLAMLFGAARVIPARLRHGLQRRTEALARGPSVRSLATRSNATSGRGARTRTDGAGGDGPDHQRDAATALKCFRGWTLETCLAEPAAQRPRAA